MTISVVTPSFNQGAFLEATIQSVLTQSYPSVEYSVLDGGSTDGSTEILSRYAARLTHWSSEPDGGQAAAIRKGFEMSTGEIQCWLNSDDLLLPDALTQVATYFQTHPDVEAVSGGAYLIDANGGLCDRFKCNYTLGVDATYSRFVVYGQEGVYQPATFWRRSAYEAVGGIDATFRFAMDLDLFARLAKRKRFGRLPVILSCFRLHAQSKTSTLDEVHHLEIQRIVARHIDGYRGRFFRRLAHLFYWTESKVRRGVLAVRQKSVARNVRAALSHFHGLGRLSELPKERR
jgi:glycosyltransferase involved in cell wall biosynthesis